MSSTLKRHALGSSVAETDTDWALQLRQWVRDVLIPRTQNPKRSPYSGSHSDRTHQREKGTGSRPFITLSMFGKSCRGPGACPLFPGATRA